MSYFCEFCECGFEIPHVIFDGTEVCPECGSEQIVEAVRCMVCNRTNSELVCEDCRIRLERKMHHLLNDNFTFAEIKALNEIFDGRDIE